MNSKYRQIPGNVAHSELTMQYDAAKKKVLPRGTEGRLALLLGDKTTPQQPYLWK